MKQQFAIVPAGKAAWVMAAVLCVVPLAIMAWSFFAEPRSSTGMALLLPQAVSVVAVVVVLAILVGALRRMQVELEDSTLVLRAAFYTQRVPVVNLDLEKARIRSLDRDSDDWPRFRSNAYALPGVLIGHFRGRPFKNKLFCILTRRDKVLLLPQRDGARTLVLSLARPQALLDALGRLQA